MGVFGSLASWLSYEAYIVGGLDGSKFSATNGIRDGRIKERPGLHEPAVTGRIDVRPFAGQADGSDLRLGLSTYFGGLDNGNKGENPDIDGKIHIYSADVEYSVGRLDLRGAIAHTLVDGAGDIGNGTASQMFGWYVEAAYHCLPDAWKKGKLADADAVVFVRHDQFDTQHRMPSGVSRDPAGDRTEWTFGVGFYPVSNLVIKADCQIRDDETTNDLDALFNFGVGWEF